MSELKPCPFCGGSASIRHWNDEDFAFWWKVECSGCGAGTRGKWVSSRSDTCPLFYEGVREEWNTRASEACEAALKAKLEKALNHLGKALYVAMRNEASEELDEASSFRLEALKELSE